MVRFYFKGRLCASELNRKQIDLGLKIIQVVEFISSKV